MLPSPQTHEAICKIDHSSLNLCHLHILPLNVVEIGYWAGSGSLLGLGLSVRVTRRVPAPFIPAVGLVGECCMRPMAPRILRRENPGGKRAPHSLLVRYIAIEGYSHLR